MKEFKVCFISHHFTTTKVLMDNIIRMTPGSSGKWKNMTAVLDPFQADYVVALDGYCHIPVPHDRVVYFGQHPYGTKGYKPLINNPNGKGYYPQEKYLNPGEWWVTFDYDTLSKMEPPKKEKDVISITTYYKDKKTYHQRTAFLEKYVQLSNNIDIYGRPKEAYEANPIFKDTYRGISGFGLNCNTLIGEHTLGKDIEINYRYAIDFDHANFDTCAPVKHYFSERFYDSMLCWTMPIYFGCDNVHEYLPENSFRYININCTGEELIKEVNKAISIVNSNFREEHLEDMRTARDLLLNKYQLWAYCYDKIISL